jgi:hypothetical protein
MKGPLQQFRMDTVLLWWLLFDIYRFDVYEYYISLGLLPKYAYEQAKKSL